MPAGQPGMEYSFTIIPDDMKMCPTCPCETRTCPLHGFCQLCAQHHADLCRWSVLEDDGAHCHFQHCKQDKMAARIGLEATTKAAAQQARDQIEAARKNRAYLAEENR